MFENRTNQQAEQQRELPDPRWLGSDDILYIDEARHVFQTTTPGVADRELYQNSQSLTTRLGALQNQTEDQVKAALNDVQDLVVEIGAKSYRLLGVIGSGEDGIIFKALDQNSTVAIKWSWPFNPQLEQQTPNDSLIQDSAILEREALMQLAHTDRILSMSGNYIIPQIRAHNVVKTERSDGSELCSSVIVMDHIECISFDEFVNEVFSEPGGLRDYIEVALGSVRANLMMHQVGADEPDEAFGVFRLDNGVRNLMIAPADGPQRYTPVCLDFGNVSVPAFTGLLDNNDIPLKDMLSSLADNSLRTLRTSLADSLAHSSCTSEFRDDVVTALRTMSGADLVKKLEEIHSQVQQPSNQHPAETPTIHSFEALAFKGRRAS